MVNRWKFIHYYIKTRDIHRNSKLRVVESERTIKGTGKKEKERGKGKRKRRKDKVNTREEIYDEGIKGDDIRKGG